MELKIKFSFRVGQSTRYHTMIVDTNDPAHARLNITEADLDRQIEMIWEASHYIRNHLIEPQIEFSPVEMGESEIEVRWDLSLDGVNFSGDFSGDESFAYADFTHDSLPIGTDWDNFLRTHLSCSQDALAVEIQSVQLFEPLMPPVERVYVVHLGHKTKTYTNLGIAKAQITRYAGGNYRERGFPTDCALWAVGVRGWELVFMSEQGQDRTVITW